MENLRAAGGLCLGLFVVLFAHAGMAEDRLRIGASELVYSDLAQQIGGDAVTVDLLDRQKIAAAGGAVAVGKYDLVLCDGTVSDAWLRDLAKQSSPRPAIVEAAPAPRASLPWYDLKTMSDAAQNFAGELTHRAPARSQEISINLLRYLEGFKSVDFRIAEIAKDYEGTDVFVTDDLFLDILAQMHFKLADEQYLKEAQSTKPSPKSVSALREAISTREGSILLYDRDSKNVATRELVAAANDVNLPAVGLRERLPAALHYQQWMLRQLNAVHGALNEAAP